MTFPTVSFPEYECQLHSIKKPVKFRPFLVREEKILLMALETEEQTEIVRSMKQILKNCNLSTHVNIETLPMFDVEFWFLNLRARSIGEVISLNINCDTCEAKSDVTIQLDEITVDVSNAIDPLIPITESISVKLRYPTLDRMFQYDAMAQSADQLFKMVIDSIESIVDGEDVFEAKLHTKKELEDFVLSLTQEQFKNIINFFTNMPRVRHIVNFTCTDCEKANVLQLEGVRNFFT